MSLWHAIVPFRARAKTRLVERLDATARAALAETMAQHVLETLGCSPLIGSIAVLAPLRPAFVPEGTGWISDEGRGLNAELAAAFAEARRTLVVHADLPLLSADDIAALIDAASEAGAAIAPDRARTGTNALALIDATALQPAFGPSSFALHRTLLPHAAAVERPGLALDIDTPVDLDHAIAAGILMPVITSPT